MDLISIEKRTELIPVLISISKEETHQFNNIPLHIQDNIEFISKGRALHLPVLEKIKEWNKQLVWKSTFTGQQTEGPNAAIIELEIKRALDKAL